MPLFVCDNCESIDNTACGGTYWTRHINVWPEEVAGRALCVECTPDHYIDGTKYDNGGKWHNVFEKVTATPEIIKEYGQDNFIYFGRFADAFK